MSTHPITAGHGYTYLTSQTMAQDASVVPVGGLGAYYSERGEAPGRWMGSGLDALGLDPDARVLEPHMVALFGHGRHPDAEAIETRLRAEGAGEDVIAQAISLGQPFALNLANTEYRRQVAQLASEWNRAEGRSACAPVPDWIMARIRTAVGQTLFAQEHRREPDARELAGFIAQQSRLGSKAVAGFDLTFSPVKSVSALWAVATPEVAAQVEAAHRAAVADTVAWLERTATFTRLGRNGVRQVETRGLIAAAFVHRASRAGDPDLHTHVAVSNKVQTLDGRWRALDGRVLFKASVAASERYNTRLEAELRDRLGVSFTDRERNGRRPVREIVGVDERLLSVWSKRRSAIDARCEQLSVAFQAEHGRPPTAAEAIALAQRATLESRPGNHDPASEADQRAAWRAEAIATLGADGLEAMLRTALTPAPSLTLALDRDQIRHIASQVVDRVQADRASWQRWHVIAEAQRALRRMPVDVRALDMVLDEIVATALGECSVALPRPDVLVEPDALRRSDGTSVYTVAGSQLYTSRSVLAAEETLIAAASRFDGRRVSEAAIEMALLEATANGLDLNEGQVALVRQLAGSGARCQLALAPAGTGKTTALRVLSRAWVEDGGRIVALAPSAAAARLLSEATGTRADTLAKMLRDLDTGDRALASDMLVLVDEAGMASTPDLARLMTCASQAGTSVRLVGDDRQLAAIGAGGILRDLAETAGAVTLATAVRFTDPDEAQAALGIRDGSLAALDFYLDGKRVHVGDEHTAAQSAYEAWVADRAAGRDSLLLAATRDQVTALNARARADRLNHVGHIAGPEVRLADGTAANAGDAIITRRNDRRLGITATDWVKNGDRWTVHAVHDGGALTAVHRDTGRHVLLPAAYVAEHVALGYAVTIHGAQGTTADTCHTVLTGVEAREQLYVAVSRGRHANHVHVALPGAADEHAPIRRDSVIPPTATDLLQRILDRENTARSATTEMCASAASDRQLRDAVERYADSLTRAPTTPDADPARPAPLPWLPPVPACADETWRTYLDARAQQITDLADQIVQDIVRGQSSGAYINRMDRFGQSHKALWRITHPETNTADLTQREQFYLRHLQERQSALSSNHGDERTDERRWLPLVAAIDSQITIAPEYPTLARHLTAAFRIGVEVDRILPGLLARHDNFADVISAVDEMTENQKRKWDAMDAVTPRVPHVDTLDHSLDRSFEQPGL
jgi:conjugative relaxase-like TrwC/TraI family protein